jgi:hypothetical protein
MPNIHDNAEQGTMVLRTVYLPVALDEELKKLAFHGSTSKGELMRRAIKKMVQEGEAAAGQPSANAETLRSGKGK